MSADNDLPNQTSTPSPGQVAARVLSAYALPQPVRYEVHRAGRNDHYRVYAGHKVYYLKVPGSSHPWKSQAQYRARLASEVAFFEHLRAHDIPVPVPVARRDGAYLSPIDAPEGQRYAMLLTGVPGQPLGDQVTLEQVRHVARLAARMHACLDLLPDDFTPVNWNLRWIVDKSLANLEPVLRAAHRLRREGDWVYAQGLGEAIRRRVEASLPTHRPAYGVIHGDFHQDNILVHEGDLAVVDAESFGRGWRAWEIAYYLSGDFSDWRFDPELEVERQRRRDAFLEAYTATRALSEAELASIPVFGAARFLLAMGRLVALGPRSVGQQSVAEAQVDGWMRFLRAWVEWYRPLR